MQQREKYPYTLNEITARFDFNSIGPNGIIKKTVDYKKVGTWVDELQVYNLAFGDWDKEKKMINDLTRTDNHDRDKVLATIASTVMDMVGSVDNIAIYAEGSTPARTRLYQMGINSNREEIEKVVHIFGYKDGRWHRFESGRNYDAFLVTKK